jgi:hypothetical protein
MSEPTMFLLGEDRIPGHRVDPIEAAPDRLPEAPATA